MRCLHCKIFKLCLAILQHYARKSLQEYLRPGKLYFHSIWLSFLHVFGINLSNKKCFPSHWLWITSMDGWSMYFKIALIVGCLFSATQSNPEYLAIFRFFTILEKNHLQFQLFLTLFSKFHPFNLCWFFLLCMIYLIVLVLLFSKHFFIGYFPYI